jgi:DNA-directed RNA polymerase specialized sigma24 family protein
MVLHSPSHSACARPRLRRRKPTSTRLPAREQVDDSKLAAAFRSLHGPRLHGFAILVSLGEAALAEKVSSAALTAGANQADSLRHPERAAAWLRARLLRALHQGNSRGASTATDARKSALAPMGVDDTVYEGLAVLGLEARAALVASAVERFEEIDIATILGSSPAAARKVIARARDRYLKTIEAQPAGASTPTTGPAGDIATRVHDVAARAMSATWRPGPPR